MQKFTLLLLSLVLLAPLGIDLYLPTLPQIAEGLDTPVNLVQTTIPLFLLVMGLGQLVTGPLVDNYGRKPIALLGLALYITGVPSPPPLPHSRCSSLPAWCRAVASAAARSWPLAACVIA